MILLFLGMTIFSCQDEITEFASYENLDNIVTRNIMSRSVIPEQFDWENSDWMPTPPEQSPIPTPWIGQGSIASTYGLDIVNDRKKSEGWELMYSTFRHEGGPLVNPYFILYNKYRGIMRIFYYLTTSFVVPSSYVTSSLSIISNHSTSLLNFMGTEIIDKSSNQKTFSQILPAPTDGSSPLASNKWYMMQYEFAYDPTISSIPYDEIQISWSAGYCNITEYKFNGKATGTIKTSVGSNSELTSQIQNTQKNTIKGVVGGISLELLNKSETDDNGGNSLGIPNKIFKNVSNGVESIIKGASSGVFSGIAGIFNALFFNGESKSLDLSVDMDINLTGNSTEQGTFPSSPTSLWMPGTDFSSSVSGYIPLYNKPLGVFNMNTYLTYNIETTIQNHIVDNICTRIATFDVEFIPEYIYLLWNYIDINPEVKAIADIEKKSVDLLYIPLNDSTHIHKPTGEIRTETIGKYDNVYIFPSSVQYVMKISSTIKPHDKLTAPPFILGVRYVLEIKPKDGSPSSLIIKTFKLNPQMNITELPDYIY